MALCWLNMCLLLALAADRLPLAQRLVDGLFPTGDGYAERLTLGRRAQLGDEMVYRSTIGRSPAGPHVQAGVRWSHVCVMPCRRLGPSPCRGRERTSYAACVPRAQAQLARRPSGALWYRGPRQAAWGDDPPPRRAKWCGSQTSHRVPRQVDSALTYGEYDLGHFCALVVRLRVKRG